jgi:hypothetical protein
MKCLTHDKKAGERQRSFEGPDDMKADPREKVVGHLFEAIDRVRDDVAKVEFWADIVTGFAQPVPEYDPQEMRVWLPPEQATNLKRSDH